MARTASSAEMARKKAAALPPLNDTLLPAEAGDVLELDELWSSAGSKANARWMWIATSFRGLNHPAIEESSKATDSIAAWVISVERIQRCVRPQALSVGF